MREKMTLRDLAIFFGCSVIIVILCWIIRNAYIAQNMMYKANDVAHQNIIFIKKGSEMLDSPYEYFEEDKNILDLDSFLNKKENEFINKDLVKTGSFYYFYNNNNEKAILFMGPENFIEKDGSITKLHNGIKYNMIGDLKRILSPKNEESEKYIVGFMRKGEFSSPDATYKKQFDDEVLKGMEGKVVVIIKE